MSNFQINDIVKGRVAGTFKVIGHKNIAGEAFVMLKTYDPATNTVGRGKLALQPEDLVAV